jgi:hypothetical protein
MKPDQACGTPGTLFGCKDLPLPHFSTMPVPAGKALIPVTAELGELGRWELFSHSRNDFKRFFTTWGIVTKLPVRSGH